VRGNLNVQGGFGPGKQKHWHNSGRKRIPLPGGGKRRGQWKKKITAQKATQKKKEVVSTDETANRDPNVMRERRERGEETCKKRHPGWGVIEMSGWVVPRNISLQLEVVDGAKRETLEVCLFSFLRKQ